MGYVVTVNKMYLAGYNFKGKPVLTSNCKRALKFSLFTAIQTSAWLVKNRRLVECKVMWG